MKLAKLKEMIGGWFIGDFAPSIYNTKEFEVGVKTYNKGDNEKNHFHKLATEFTVVASGHIMMNGEKYVAGDIIMIAPNEATDFKALEDNTITVVVKIPSIKGDKYYI
jgi:quercetin dioxygenase-like cupin family protein